MFRICSSLERLRSILINRCRIYEIFREICKMWFPKLKFKNLTVGFVKIIIINFPFNDTPKIAIESRESEKIFCFPVFRSRYLHIIYKFGFYIFIINPLPYFFLETEKKNIKLNICL